MSPHPENPLAHILVVDDDARLRRLLQRYLSEQGYAVSVAEDAAQAQAMLALMTPDVMVLDVMMPGQSGLDFARDLQHNAPAFPVPPILMLTAMDTAEDRINGLEAGVEDYLTKPFEPRELLLRLTNILKRRPAERPAAAWLRLGSYRFDREAGQVMDEAGQPISLTTSERALLSAMAQQPNQPQSREALAEVLEAGDSLRHVDVQIGRLRKKLGEASAIQTVRGKGYQLVAKEEQA